MFIVRKSKSFKLIKIHKENLYLIFKVEQDGFKEEKKIDSTKFDLNLRENFISVLKLEEV